MHVRFSSTLPNAFDTASIAKAKLLQIANGEALAVEVNGTVEYSTTDNEAYDTEAITLEKIIQGGSIGGIQETPPLTAGQQILQADDGTWHLMDLVQEAGVNVLRVIQTSAASPGPQYNPYIVLDAGPSNHRVSILNEGGVYVPYIDPFSTSQTGAANVVLLSSDAVSYDVSITPEAGGFVFQIEQP